MDEYQKAIKSAVEKFSKELMQLEITPSDINRFIDICKSLARGDVWTNNATGQYQRSCPTMITLDDILGQVAMMKSNPKREDERIRDIYQALVEAIAADVCENPGSCSRALIKQGITLPHFPDRED